MPAEKTKILIVDDLPEKLLVYQVILEELGQQLIMARSGAEALKQVLQHDFAVILLDVNMPDMDGFETAALIRRRKRSAHTPIIFVTAFADEVRAAEGYAHGAVDYILTPVVPEVLRAKVQVFVELFNMTAQVKRQVQEQIALAEERSRRALAEEANRRLSFLTRAGVVLGHSLDYDVTSRDIARICVPTLADQALLAQRDEAGNWTVIEASAAAGEVAVVQAGGLSPLPTWCAEHIERAVDASAPQSLFAHELEQHDLAELGYPGEATLQKARSQETSTEDGSPHAEQPVPKAGRKSNAKDARQLAGREPQAVILPLQARGRTFAALVLSRSRSQRTFAPADITMAEALVSRAAIALDNALLYREVEQADQQKNEFLSMLAHELRNPLAPIRNAVAVLRMQQDENPETAWAQDVIDRQVSHLVRLVDDLLDVSRITRGKIRLELECVEVSAIATTAVETSRPLVEAGGHHLSVELPEEPLLVNADEARLSQVLANLLNNAAKYTPSGGSIWLRVYREGDEAVFSVRDTGIGIPPEMLPRVFDLFTQVERSLDRSQGGLGIGLTLVQRLVEMHGGSVRATSAGSGQGSEFIVRLPVAAGAQSRAAGENGALATSPPSQLRVLVVDDNADAADSLAMLLRFAGHHVRIAYDGQAGVEAAFSFHPQAVVLDLGLPGIDGYEVARRLREAPETSDVLLLALSGYGRDEDHRRTTAAGFDHHFVKPVDFAALSSLLSAYVGNGKAEGQVARQG